MATFKAVILKQDKRSDNTYNVKVRVIHNRKVGIIGTQYYVKKKTIDNNTLVTVEELVISKYRKIVLGISNLSELNVKQLVDLLKRDDNPDIDFFEFTDTILADLKKRGRMKTHSTYQTTKNRIMVFTGLKSLPMSMITASFLERFEIWLRRHKERVEKKNKGKISYDEIWKECDNTTINLYMRNIRALFNMARSKYNDEDTGDIRIKHYPFKKYKIPEANESQNRNIEVEYIKKIRDFKAKRKLDILGIDVFMISFYLVGMNTVDIYNCDMPVKGRIVYNRSKVEGKLKDKAKISIKVEPELLPLLDKYKGKKRAFNFSEHYSNVGAFNKYVNRGLNRVGEELELPRKLTTYVARHSWATIAANDCKIPEQEVHRCLNHADPDMKVTRIYIEKDWSFLDESNRKVLDMLK